MRRFQTLRYKWDIMAIVGLVLLWGIFFWRVLTPVTADKASFEQGDFSAQFVAFGAYQYERFAEGEVPLWNPYNNGGLPFIADTQAAVFYPPRLLTVALAQMGGGWSYQALQLEAIFHVLLLSLLMYLFVRRLTLDMPHSVFGAFVAAVIAAYGGFTSGYAPLQLALLESGVWLPLAALGILEATRHTNAIGWRCLALAGTALGFSWLAGHPQTAWFSTYTLVAWLGYRVYVQRIHWTRFLAGTLLMGVITLGVMAITFLPGVEYLLLASRAEMGFPAKDGGFPLQDVLQMVFPGSVSVFSPLYAGIPALVFAFISGRYRLPNAAFWLGAAFFGLLHSFGGHTVFYHALYNIVPGLRFFRGQERAAFVVAYSLAIAAGIGAAHLSAWTQTASQDNRWLTRFMRGLLALIGGLTALIVVGWFGGAGDFGGVVGTAVLSTIVMALTYALITGHEKQPRPLILVLLAGLIVFELFSVNMFPESNYDDVPPDAQFSQSAPPLVQAALDDMPPQPFRVDGFRGLEGNFGSVYGLMDIRGISPLFFEPARQIIYRDYVNNPLAWELFSVRYVFSEREGFGYLETDVLADGADSGGTVYLHEIRNPRPYAHLVYRADVVDSQEFAFALLDDPRYQLRESVILERDPAVTLPERAPVGAQASVTQYEPEFIEVDVSTPENALLSLAHVHYPGWQARLNGEPVDSLRAYGALTAIAVPAGQHVVTLTYNPLMYRAGVILSLFTFAGLAILAVFGVWSSRRV